jgi:phage terminase small subunit
MAKLTPKQKLFCDYYLISLNATDAAIKAGYSERSAQIIGFENLTKPIVKEYVEAKQVKLQEKIEVTQQMVLEELHKIGFSNIQDLMEEGFAFRDIIELEKNQAAAIESVKVKTTTRTFDGNSETTKEVTLKKFDKVKALEQLGKHLGFFEVDNKQKGLKFKVNVSK